MGHVDIRTQASKLLANLQFGRIRSVAYDTAWAARPMKNEIGTNNPEFPGALRWLLRNQLWDGSWGSEIEYMHDRLLSTTAAVNSLQRLDGGKYEDRIAMGIDYLWKNMDRLDQDPYETIGSELLLPSQLVEGQDLGLDIPEPPLAIKAKRERKLGLIPEEMIYSSGTTLAFSLEFLGDDVKPDELEKCIYPNGSLGCSPSATMFLIEHTGNAKAKEYMQWASDWMWSGGMPSQLPFETFEFSWSLYNLWKAGIENVPGTKVLLDQLYWFWKTRRNGVSWGNAFPCSDSDTSAIAFKVLWEHGYKPDARVFEAYEVDKGFKCSEYELNPSISAHIHILEAIQDLPVPELPRKEEMMEKIIRYLSSKLIDGKMWTDKWHASPYYTTGHAIMALARNTPELVKGPIDWLLRSQSEDGGWGYYGRSTVEETAYAIQALIEYASFVEPIDGTPIIHGAQYLNTHRCDNFERQWIAKGLYCPVNVVKSSVIAAIQMINSTCGYDPIMDTSIEPVEADSVQEKSPGGL
jgi:halimadienyl-diphosphate synthase